MRRFDLRSFLLVPFLALGCQAPPVWRSADYGPDRPTPTLEAAGAYEFHQATQEASFNLKQFGKAKVKVDGGQLAQGVGRIMASVEEVRALTGAIQAAGPRMQAKALDFLRSQGFEMEVDSARANKRSSLVMPGRSFAFVTSAAAASPFGSLVAFSDGKDGTFPLMGDGTKSDTVDPLRTDREREAYASVHAAFRLPKGGADQGLECHLIIQVLDRDAELVFEGRTVGTSVLRGDVEQAFDRALEQMREPVIR